MKVSCEVARDLLPLYHDGVCSESSRRLVGEHLTECESCKGVLEKIKSSTVDDRLKSERDNVVGHHAKAVKRKSFITGISIASVMAVPILVSLIVNLATGHALDWFFIVLTSLMVAASVTVVPLVFEERRGLWTLGSFTGSLILLLMTCAIYSGGGWFFVAVIPVLLGLCVLFAPYVLSQMPLKGFAARHKGLVAMTLDTLLLFAVIFVSGLYVGGGFADYWRPALLITSLYVLFPWGLFLMIRYIKANAFVRAGLSTIFGGVFLTFGIFGIDWILAGNAAMAPPYRWSGANLFVWNNATIDPNVHLLILLTGCVVGGALLAVGLTRRKKGRG